MYCLSKILDKVIKLSTFIYQMIEAHNISTCTKRPATALKKDEKKSEIKVDFSEKDS